MRKKFVFIGIGLLIAAAVLFVLSGYFLTSGFSGSVNYTNIVVGAHNFSYFPVNYNHSISALAVYTVLNKPANLYLLNSSAFLKWDNYMKVNGSAVSGYEYVQRISQNSTYIFNNATFEVIPLNLKVSKLSANQSGSVYVVIDNTKGSKSYSSSVNATISYVPLSGSTVMLSAGLGYGVVVLGIAGIIGIIWGLLKKDDDTLGGKSDAKEDKTKEQKEYLDKLYKGVKKGKKE